MKGDLETLLDLCGLLETFGCKNTTEQHIWLVSGPCILTAAAGGVKVFLQVQFTATRHCDPNSSTRRQQVCKSRKQMSSSGESDSGQ